MGGEPQEGATWQQLLDDIEAGVEQLAAVAMDDAEAEAAVKRAERVGRRLFYWRRNVEAAFFDKYANVPGIVAAVALQEGIPQPQALAELMAAGGLQPVWWALDKWATEHGVNTWPDNTRKEPTDDSDDRTE